jgi:hypothetical protein
MRNQQIRAKERAIEYVERNMFIAKEALNKEIVNIMRQVDKTNMEKDEMIRGVKFLENYIRE